MMRSLPEIWKLEIMGNGNGTIMIIKRECTGSESDICNCQMRIHMYINIIK